MKCELCSRENGRRRRYKTKWENKLICWDCFWALLHLNNGDPSRYLITSYSAECHLRRSLEKEIAELKAIKSLVSLKKPAYKFNNPVSAVPPKEVLEKALIALDEMRFYSEFSKVLGDYYGIEAPPYYSKSTMVPSGAIACYYPSENEVYALKERPLSHKTAYHEFWHALERHGIVPNTADSEKNADLYAKICLKTSGESA